MASIIIYSTNHCPYCAKAKRLLDLKQARYEEINIEDRPEKQEEMISLSGRRSVPQIFINDQHIGGCDDLYALDALGKLDELLK